MLTIVFIKRVHKKQITLKPYSLYTFKQCKQFTKSHFSVRLFDLLQEPFIQIISNHHKIDHSVQQNPMFRVHVSSGDHRQIPNENPNNSAIVYMLNQNKNSVDIFACK